MKEKTEQFKYIDLEQLKLDPNNPRLPKSFRKQNPNEKLLIEHMLEDESIIELMLSIGQNGFFEGEQLLVVEDNENTYRVIEGNRRLTALKLLRNPNLSSVYKNKIRKVIEETSERPIEIPCLEFKDEDEIHKRIGFRHITGIKEWRLLERARYLNNVWKSNYTDLSISDVSRILAKNVGSTSDYIKRVLLAYELYKVLEDANFYKIRDLDDDSVFYLNYYVDSLQNSRSNIQEWLGIEKGIDDPLRNLNEENFKLLNQAWFEKNDQNKTRLLGNSHDLNSLSKLLGNQEAVKAFFEERVSLIRALELAGEKDERFEEAINKALRALEDANGLAHKVKNFYPTWQDDLSSIQLLVKTIKITAEEIENG